MWVGKWVSKEVCKIVDKLTPHYTTTTTTIPSITHTPPTFHISEPTPVSSVESVPLDESSLLVVWTPGAQEECVTYYHVCVTDVVDLTQDCVDTSSIEETFVVSGVCVNGMGCLLF